MEKGVRQLISVVVIFVAIAMASCSDTPDGAWTPMKWSVENKNPETISITNDKKYAWTTITVDYKGGGVDYTCKNYTPWIDLFCREGVDIPEIDYNTTEIEGDWYYILLENRTVYFHFKERPSESEPETIKLVVTAGDVFRDFTIVSTR